MKEISLSRNGIFSKLYRFVYRTSLPMGLCNFFWANLIALVLLVPYTIWCLPTIVVNAFISIRDKKSFIDDWVSEFDDEFWNLFWNLMGINFLCWAALALVGAYGYGIYWMVTMCQYFVEPTAIFWILNAVFLAIFIGWAWNNVIVPWWKKWNRERDMKRAEAWYLGMNDKITEEYREQWLLKDYYNRGKYEDKEPVTLWTTIIWTAIKSFYEKNCPVINWK